MPQPIVIQFLSGPNMGQRQRFTKGPIKFGRDADLGLVLAEPFVSRQHGELVVDDRDRWCLVNLSPNGTRINARLITATDGKSRRLRDGDTVSVGNQPVFTIKIEGPPPEEAHNEVEDDEDDARKLSVRSKVWIGIGVYMLLMLGLVVFMSTLDRDGTGPGSSRPNEISAAEIAMEIERALPPAQPPSPAVAARHLQQAREWYARRGVNEAAAFHAHDHYKRSLAADNLIAFPQGVDQQRYLEVQAELVQQVESRYRQGFNQLVAGNYQGALQTFDRLIAIYPDKDSRIYKNALAMRNFADKQRGRRR
jgi:pSer/pThr/pTyr-binding forkhead associated (FHA) protein